MPDRQRLTWTCCIASSTRFPHLIYVKDESGRFLFANSVVADCYGTSKELLIGTLQQNRHPVAEELDFFLEEDRLVLSKGEPRATEHFFTDVSGKRRLMHCIKAPFITSENTPAILCISFDYTECKKHRTRARTTTHPL